MLLGTYFWQCHITCLIHLRDESKFEMGDGKRPLDVRGEGVKGLDVKKFNCRTKCSFSFPNMLSLSNPK